MMYFTHFHSRLCDIFIVGNEEGISHLHLNTGEGTRRFSISEQWRQNDAFFRKTVIQMNEYFNGKRQKFDLRINPQGTVFQKQVWEALSAIPYGEVRTYGDIAKTIGNEKAARAVGMANSKNPIPVIIPCHRVIGAGGKLTGFAHGLSVKEKLIHLEQAAV